MDNLYFAMREAAYLLPANEDKRVEVFTRYDGLNIPASTLVRVTVELIHTPDPEITPELVMEAVAV
jgi:hypothetical protein